MKQILITGANSYIGMHIERFLNSYVEEYCVDTIDVKNNEWENADFSGYDVIVHVAGIAHIRETPKNEKLFFEVNEKLAVKVADKAKKSKVSQFILMSSMSVYGMVVGHITKSTKPNPVSNYGKAKYNADLKIANMASDSFKVAIVRPPIVYGKDCKGNYQQLRNYALKVPFFPMYNNERSMIWIDNLTLFIKKLIDDEKHGVYHPQDVDYICTYKMVQYISEANNKNMRFFRFGNWCISILLKMNIPVICKVFGSLTYEREDIVGECDLKSVMFSIEG